MEYIYTHGGIAVPVKIIHAGTVKRSIHHSPESRHRHPDRPEKIPVCLGSGKDHQGKPHFYFIREILDIPGLSLDGTGYPHLLCFVIRTPKCRYRFL